MPYHIPNNKEPKQHFLEFNQNDQNDYEQENIQKIMSMSQNEINDAMNEINTIFSLKSIENLINRQSSTLHKKSNPSNDSTSQNVLESFIPNNSNNIPSTASTTTTNNINTSATTSILQESSHHYQETPNPNQDNPNPNPDNPYPLQQPIDIDTSSIRTIQELHAAVLIAPTRIQSNLAWTQPNQLPIPITNNTTTNNNNNNNNNNNPNHEILHKLRNKNNGTNLSKNNNSTTSTTNNNNTAAITTTTTTTTTATNNNNNKTTTITATTTGGGFRLSTDRFDLNGHKVISPSLLYSHLFNLFTSNPPFSSLPANALITLCHDIINTFQKLHFFTIPPTENEIYTQPQHELYHHQYDQDTPGYSFIEISEVS
jgi:hypothetical protein